MTVTLHLDDTTELEQLTGLSHTELERLALEAFMVRLYAQAKISSGHLAQILTISPADALRLLGSYQVAVDDPAMDVEQEARSGLQQP
jgi:hypothetical protein